MDYSIDDLISRDWLKHLKHMMPDKCREYYDNNDGEIGKNDSIGWFVLKDGIMVWSENQPTTKDDNCSCDNDSDGCPDCGGDCYHMEPFKQCKKCKNIYRDNEIVCTNEII